MERELVASRDEARRDYERACRELNGASGTAHPEVPSPNGADPENAAKLRDLAYARYRDALQKFTHFVTHGKFPAASNPSRQPALETDAHSAEGGAR